MKLKLLFSICILSFAFQLTKGQTSVSGTISSDADWTIFGSPYIVTDDVIVDTNVILTIDPGVTVKFDNNKSMEVNGTIKAAGKDDSIITFTADAVNPTQPYWSGIYLSPVAEPFNSFTLSGCQFKYFAVEYSGTPNFYLDSVGPMFAIYSEVSCGFLHGTFQHDNCGLRGSGSTYVENCIFQDNNSTEAIGAVVKVGSGSTVNQNIFYNNTVSNSEGIVSCTKNVKVFNNVFVGNQFSLYNALAIQDSSLFYGNTFVDNTNVNASLGSGTLVQNTFIRNQENPSMISLLNADPKFYNNNIAGNYLDQPGGMDNEVFGVVQGSNPGTANIENNWWGSTDSTFIASVVEDHNDESDLCTLDFVPYLASPDTDAPVMPPASVFKKELPNGDVQVRWNKNHEADLAGYKVYYNGFTGYSFTDSVHIGLDTFAVISGVSINDTFGVTAYDKNYDTKYDQLQGNESWFSYADLDTSTTVGIPGLTTDSDFQIYPNPCSETFLVQSSGLASPNTKLTILDAFGRKVKEIIPQRGTPLSVSTDGLRSGLYEVELVSNNKVVDRCKLVVQKTN